MCLLAFSSNTSLPSSVSPLQNRFRQGRWLAGRVHCPEPAIRDFQKLRGDKSLSAFLSCTPPDPKSFLTLLPSPPLSSCDSGGSWRVLVIAWWRWKRGCCCVPHRAIDWWGHPVIPLSTRAAAAIAMLPPAVAKAGQMSSRCVAMFYTSTSFLLSFLRACVRSFSSCACLLVLLS